MREQHVHTAWVPRVVVEQVGAEGNADAVNNDNIQLYEGIAVGHALFVARRARPSGGRAARVPPSSTRRKTCKPETTIEIQP